MSPADNGYELPEVVAPPTVTFCIEVPDEDAHLRAFWGALWSLTRPYNWGNDDAHTALEVGAFWRDLWFKNHKNWRERECCTDDDNCSAYDANENRATFYPEIDATDLPLGYVVNPWVRITGPNPLVGLKTGDIITDLPHIPPLPSIWDHLDDIGTILALGYPSVSITGLVGRGTVRLYLISVLLGGRAIIVRDNDLLTTAFLDTNLDTASLPPETYAENLVEYKFETSGEHRIDVVFIPNVSADIEFLGYGGGFRRVEICGFEENGGDDMACCDDTNVLLSKIVSLLEGGITGTFNFGGSTNPPDVGGGDCAPDYFDHDTDDTGELDPEKRALALCVTIQRYIKGVMLGALRDMGAPQFVIDYILATIAQDVPLSLSNLTVSYPLSFSGLAVFFAVVSATLSFDALVCIMLDGLSGDKNNTSANFKASMPETSEGLDALLVPLMALIRATNQKTENYKAFNLALNDAFNEDLTGAECPCEETPPEGCTDEELDIIVGAIDDPADLDIVITREIGTNVWHFVQNTFNSTVGAYRIIFKDANGCCIDVQAPPEGYTAQASATWVVDDCCDVHSNGVGGFAGQGRLIAIGYGGSTIDTYFEITAAEEPECE